MVNLPSHIECLEHDGAICLSDILDLDRLQRCLTLAQSLSYVERPKTYGKRQVRQEVASAAVVQGSELGQLADYLEEGIQKMLQHVCATPLRFNHRNIQRYPHASHGIDPHRDHSHNCNLIALFTLGGEGSFSLYDELDASPRQRLILRPNSLLLMKARGFLGQQECPIHGVDHIRGSQDGFRYLLGLRQNERNTQ